MSQNPLHPFKRDSFLLRWRPPTYYSFLEKQTARKASLSRLPTNCRSLIQEKVWAFLMDISCSSSTPTTLHQSWEGDWFREYLFLQFLWILCHAFQLSLSAGVMTAVSCLRKLFSSCKCAALPFAGVVWWPLLISCLEWVTEDWELRIPCINSEDLPYRSTRSWSKEIFTQKCMGGHENQTHV